MTGSARTSAHCWPTPAPGAVRGLRYLNDRLSALAASHFGLSILRLRTLHAGTRHCFTMDETALLYDARPASQPTSEMPSRELPHSFAKLRLDPDWLTGILPAMKSEIGGLIESKIYSEIPWEPWMKGKLIPKHRIDERRPGKYKSRFVAESNRTFGEGVHFGEVAASMASFTAVKMIVAFAAGCGQGFYSLNFRQAYLQAPVENPNLLIKLPDLPQEMMASEFGTGKFGASGHHSGKFFRLNKALYGLRESPRLWSRFLIDFPTHPPKRGGIGARVLASDRNVVKCSWGGQTQIAACHVDDTLLSPSGPEIHAEFSRRALQRNSADTSFVVILWPVRPRCTRRILLGRCWRSTELLTFGRSILPCLSGLPLWYRGRGQLRTGPPSTSLCSSVISHGSRERIPASRLWPKTWLSS